MQVRVRTGLKVDIASTMIAGDLIMAGDSYRVTVNSFLASRGVELVFGSHDSSAGRSTDGERPRTPRP